MLVNKLGSGNMDFGKKVKMRIWGSAVLIVLGAITAGIVLFLEPLSAEYSNDASFLLGFYFGLGFGLIGAGTATIIKNTRYLKNADKFKAAEIAYKDERNRFISNKTWSVSALAMLVLIYLAVIISGVYNMMVFRTLLMVLGVFGLVLLIVNTTLKRIY
ncbi:MAG: hypothetical protein FWG06_04360 [Clostridiales bacterium]|nr:hypothetical protein [Clostridiales bacterium]